MPRRIPFSEREGLTPAPEPIAYGELSPELRNTLWNLVVHEIVSWHSFEVIHALISKSVAGFFRGRLDVVPSGSVFEARRFFDKLWTAMNDAAMLNYIEYFVDQYPSIYGLDHRTYASYGSRVVAVINEAFEEHLAPYRFVQGVLTGITSDMERNKIESAADAAASAGVQGAKAHIRTALTLMSKRPEPDYRNSIKESISAVETTVRKLSGRDNLSDALRAIGTPLKLHGALVKGFDSLYGYTSDAKDGIRHAMLDEDTLAFEDAQYMVVSCSAFVHYLIQKADKAKRVAP